MSYHPKSLSGLGCAAKPLSMGSWWSDLITSSGGSASAPAGDALLFNSTKYPGICKPSNTYTLGKFRNLQLQLNRAAQAKGISTRIAIDGDIGPGTISLCSKVIGTPANAACSAIATMAVAHAAVASAIATAAGVPAQVTTPTPPRPSTLVLPNGGEIAAPPSSAIAANLSAQWNALSAPMKVAGVGVAAALSFVAYKAVKKGRR